MIKDHQNNDNHIGNDPVMRMANSTGHKWSGRMGNSHKWVQDTLFLLKSSVVNTSFDGLIKY